MSKYVVYKLSVTPSKTKGQFRRPYAQVRLSTEGADTLAEDTLLFNGAVGMMDTGTGNRTYTGLTLAYAVLVKESDHVIDLLTHLGGIIITCLNHTDQLSLSVTEPLDGKYMPEFHIKRMWAKGEERMRDRWWVCLDTTTDLKRVFRYIAEWYLTESMYPPLMPLD